MVRACHCAPAFDAAHPVPHTESRRPTSASLWPIVTAPGMILDALREGLAAHRRYEHLRSRGVPHDTALRKALGMGPSPSHEGRQAATPIYFAGKA